LGFQLNYHLAKNMASDSESSTYSDLTSVKSDAMGEPIVNEVDLEVVMSDISSSSTCARRLMPKP